MTYVVAFEIVYFGGLPLKGSVFWGFFDFLGAPPFQKGCQKKGPFRVHPWEGCFRNFSPFGVFSWNHYKNRGFRASPKFVSFAFWVSVVCFSKPLLYKNKAEEEEDQEEDGENMGKKKNKTSTIKLRREETGSGWWSRRTKEEKKKKRGNTRQTIGNCKEQKGARRVEEQNQGRRKTQIIRERDI